MRVEKGCLVAFSGDYVDSFNVALSPNPLVLVTD